MPSTIPPRVMEQIDRVGAFVSARDDAWSVPRVTAEFLHGIVLAAGLRSGLEIGTSYGFSGLWIGAALAYNGGRLVTIEKDTAKARYAGQAFARAGLDGVITVLCGDARELLGAGGPAVDFVFIDADKESSLRYFELVWPRLVRRGTIVTDNITSHAEQMAGFVRHLRGHPGLYSVLVPIGSGIELSVRVVD